MSERSTSELRPAPLNKLKSCKAIGELQALEFRELLVRLLEKIIERSPVKYSIARNMTCLDPRYMAKHRVGSKLKLNKIVGGFGDTETDS